LEVADKVKKGQVKLVLWDDIKQDPPKELKILPIAMIPHKSRKFRAIWSVKVGENELFLLANGAVM
jgi:hypothetical protein